MILRRIARPLLAAIFISGGVNALRQSEGHAKAAEPFFDKTLGKQSEKLPDSVPTDGETLVKLDGAVKVGAGALLALGKCPRLAAALLLASLVPTTAAGHPFWEEEDEEARQNQLIHFLKNAGLAGGLLLAMADTEGKPSLGWRARHAAQETGKRVGDGVSRCHPSRG
ncbi:DoxX family membrane protein [Streptomyces armeniacus]|uniref:DoxX family membrane protein n=1 Tax=Streptomyces armeniacus TaxID=83291 RepID=UPI001AD81D22|nr:DoxX family membrane protein [Streptomyces armeniacus]